MRHTSLVSFIIVWTSQGTHTLTVLAATLLICTILQDHLLILTRRLLCRMWWNRSIFLPRFCLPTSKTFILGLSVFLLQKHIVQPPSHRFISHMVTTAQIGLVKPGARNFTQVFHRGDREASPWAITYCFHKSICGYQTEQLGFEQALQNWMPALQAVA